MYLVYLKLVSKLGLLLAPGSNGKKAPHIIQMVLFIHSAGKLCGGTGQDYPKAVIISSS
jgi:hypothetical protein